MFESQAIANEGMLRADVMEAYDAIASLETHRELIRDILAEVTLLSEKYRTIRRHDVPHVTEIAGLLDVLWQEVEMVQATPRGLLEKV
jgi:hypothetical protein